MSGESRAVFLSYASEDAEASARIAEALKAARIEVWFDKSELRGGDAWDRKIRAQIHECRLFIPIISAHSQRRLEGYFRREWKLAVDRTHDMAEEKAFLVPVVIDDTLERYASVPDKFRDVQWTHLASGETSAAFIERVSNLLAFDHAPTSEQRRPMPARAHSDDPKSQKPTPDVGRFRWSRLALLIATVFVIAVAYLAVDGFWLSKRGTLSAPPKRTSNGYSIGVENSIPEKSIAVLPFLDLSERHDQEYFSDGLSEELIDLLTKVPDLRVPARTSSFFFKGKSEDVATIAQKLRVANVLEGSVRKSANTIRVTAQLIRAESGYHLWSETYDRELKDVFKLQDEIAVAVVGALKLKLASGQETDRPASGNLEAYNAMLEGKYYLARDTDSDNRKAIERFTRATQLDPQYALAWSLLSRAWTNLAGFHLNLATASDAYARARVAVDTALSLNPDLASGHIARGWLLETADFNWRGAEAEYRRALELAPESGDAAANLARQLATFGELERAIELTQQALATDPLRSRWFASLAVDFYALNRLDEAEGAIRTAIELQPSGVWLRGVVLTNIEIRRGDPKAALAAAQQEPPSFFQEAALAKALEIGGDRASAEAALKTLLDKGPSWDPYDVAQLYAMRGDADKTFEWLDQAWKYRDPSIHNLLYDPLIGRYKGDPRFAAYSRKIGLAVPVEAKGPN